MKNSILLLMALLFSACSTHSIVGATKKYNYNHKPYIKLKFKRANYE